jgi:hypothetical protein
MSSTRHNDNQHNERAFLSDALNLQSLPDKRPLDLFIDHSNRWMLRQRDDAGAAMAIAARTLHVTQRYTNGSLRVTRFHAQI